MSLSIESPAKDGLQSKPAHSELLYNFLYALFKGKYFALLIFGVTFIGILFGTYLVPTSWKATAKLRVQYSTKQQLSLFEGITTPGGQIQGVNPANDIIQILTSRELAETIVKEFERDKLWEQRTNAPAKVKEIIRWHIKDFLIGRPIRVLQYIGVLNKKPDNYLAKAVEEMLEDLEDIELEEDTTIINVGVWGESPEVATALSNRLVELVLQKNRELSRAPLHTVLDSTQRQLLVAEANLKESQEKLRRFKDKSGLLSYEQESTLLLNRLDSYNNDLKDLEGQLAALRIDKKPSHPEVRAISAKIDEYRLVIIPKIMKKLQELPFTEVEFEELTRDLKVHQDLYMMLKERILEIAVLMNSDIGDVELKVLDPAKVYSFVKPDWPKMVMTIPLALFASLFSALAFVLFIEYWRTSFKSVKELESELPLPALGAIPAVPFYNREKVFGYMMDPGTEITGNRYLAKLAGQAGERSLSAYERLADTIRLTKRNEPAKIHLISSPGPGEGKSTTAVFLARTLAQHGKKVLIIEADMRGPSLEGILDVKSSRGLIDYFSGELEAEDIVISAGGVAAIFAGGHFRKGDDPFDVLASDKMAGLLEYARENYDYVLIDTPSIKLYREALILARSTDGVILLVEADKTPKRSILMAVEKIKRAEGSIDGLVLTKQTDYVPELILGFLD